MNPTLVSIGALRRPPHAFALVIVLVILSLLVVITVGFLSSMSAERATASAFTNRTRAEQAAQAGVDSAIGILRDYIKAFPDSATAWDTAQATGTDSTGKPVTSEGTTLYLRAMPQANDAESPDPTLGPNATDANLSTGNNPNNAIPATAANIANGTAGKENRQTFVLPLVSGAKVKLLKDKITTLPTLTADSGTTLGNSVNLNARRQLGDTQGWIGSPPGYVNSNNPALPKPFTVPWVEITQKDGYVGTAQPPVVGRYAFWVEDESFRANVSYAKLGINHFRRDNAQDPVPPAPSINPSDVDVFGLYPVLSGFTLGEAKSIFDARMASPGLLFPDPHAFAHAGENPPDSALSTNTVNGLRFLTTTQSAGLNLSRHGTQRLNLNAVVPQTPAVDVGTGQATIQKQVDKLVQTMLFHVPNFGQRLYRTSTTASSSVLNAFSVPLYSSNPTDPNILTNCDRIYFYKVAANIRDYIDPDPIPTIINRGGKVRDPGKPTIALEAAGQISIDGPSEIWAQGKDSAPFIQECATRFRGGPTPDHSRYSLWVDYYIEVWNMSNLDVKGSDLGLHPVIRVANPTQWKGAGPTLGTATVNLKSDDALNNTSPSDTRYVTPPKRDYDIDVSGVTFKAGVATVITTDRGLVTNLTDDDAATDWQSIITDPEARKHVYLCPFYPGPNDPGAYAKRLYNGPMPAGATYLRMIWGEPGGSAQTLSSDYETDVVFSNDNQVIDSLEGCLPIYNGGSSDITLSYPLNSQPYFLGGSLHGNSSTAYPGALGDPRSNNEQLYFTHYNGNSSDYNQTRYFNETSTDLTSPTNGMGIPNTKYTHPDGSGSGFFPWPDYYTWPSGPVMTGLNAPSVIANAALTSIGQLGDIYDPARIALQTPTAIRGGGRTFKVGQHDDLWDGDVTSASHGWASWRLADIFCVADVMDQPGLININGVTRDNGAALRAALNGFKFQPNTTGTAQPAGQLLNVDTTTPGLQSVINQIKTRVAATPPANFPLGYTGAGPFFERGELSEMPPFGRNAADMPSFGNAAADLMSGVSMATALDREREEVFRRLAEMITTRGSVFTVYALGQSINQSNPADPKTKRITGTQEMRVTFKLVPKAVDPKNVGQYIDFHPATDANGNPVDFNPNDSSNTVGNATSPSGMGYRFSKPDHYDIQILSVSSGNS